MGCCRRRRVGRTGHSSCRSTRRQRGADGTFDGCRFDTEGHLWTSTKAGVSCYAPDGELLGKIRLPEAVSNLTFGGPKKNRLFITATTSLYSLFVNARGAQTP